MEEADGVIVRREGVDEAGAGGFGGGEVARLRTAQDDVGGAHDIFEAGGAGGLSSREGGGEFRNGDAVAQGLLDVAGVGVVVGGDGDLGLLEEGDEGAAIGFGVLELLFGFGADEFGEPVVLDGAHALEATAEAGKVGDLALAGGVVHEGGEAEAGVVEDGFEESGGVGVREFAADVQVVVRAKVLGLIEGADGVGEEGAGEAVDVAIDANADGVEDGGDAECGDLGVMREEGGKAGPAGAAGLEVFFEIVGVDFDQAGEQEVAIKIEGGGGGARRIGNFGDAAGGDFEGAEKGGRGADQAAVGKNHGEGTLDDSQAVLRQHEIHGFETRSTQFRAKLGFVLFASERVLWPDGELRPGTIEIAEGKIARVSEEAAGAWDLGSRLVLPGLIDLHGDAFERQWMPRSGVFFPLDIALVDSDRQLLANGITTAFHGLTVSWEPGLRGIEHGRLMVEALEGMRGKLLCDTRLHLRYETYALGETEELLEWMRAGRVDLLGFNDHMEMIAKKLEQPGKGEQYAERSGLSHKAFAELLERTREREAAVWPAVEEMAATAREKGIPMASHDDETPEMRARYHALGVGICEFPLDMVTAQSAVAAGQTVLLGGPNVVRGRSHTRRLSARAAMEAGLGGALVSDYYYPALVQGLFRLVRDRVLGMGDAWALGAAKAAKAAGLLDRGEIREGMRADLAVVDDSEAGLPRVAATIVEGRVAYMADPELWAGVRA